MEIKELTCIRCPIGCQLEVTIENRKVTKVENNQCKRGIEYAETELLSPVRGISTTIPIKNGKILILPVKTSIEVPKGDIFKVMSAVRTVVATAPVTVGDIIVENIGDTNANLVATRTVEAR